MNINFIVILYLLMGANYNGVEKQLKYLALGDSYTIGVNVNEQDRWPVLFVKQLVLLGLDIDTPKIIAQNGWTTADLIAAINKESIKDTFDLVSICIGVNNQYQGRDPEEFRMEFNELLQMSIKFAGNKKNNVIVLSIPNWGKTPFAKDRDRSEIEKNITVFNKVKKEECIKLGVHFVDITELTLLADNKPELLTSDSLHYSGKMHQIWVDEILKNLKNKKWEIPSLEQLN